MNRRAAISILSAAALAAGKGLAQTATPPQRVTPEVAANLSKAGSRPALCVYSGSLARIPYAQLAEIVGDLGYDGVDLTVMKGGHVDPSLYMVDLDRAFQTFQDAGLQIPMVTTSFTSPSQPYAYAILYVSAQLGARFCRLGVWPPPGSEMPPPGLPAAQNAQMRAMMLRNELAQFAATGQRCNIVPLITNHAGSFPGRSVPEMEALLAGVDPKVLAYCFDPAQAVVEGHTPDAWEAALRASLPRLAAVSLSDVAIDKDGALKPCALGEGAIDWKKFFGELAVARFHGPISMHMNYETKSDVNAMKKDLAFARARVAEAWPG